MFAEFPVIGTIIGAGVANVATENLDVTAHCFHAKLAGGLRYPIVWHIAAKFHPVPVIFA
jgi:hypothetical protein